MTATTRSSTGALIERLPAHHSTSTAQGDPYSRTGHEIGGNRPAAGALNDATWRLRHRDRDA